MPGTANTTVNYFGNAAYGTTTYSSIVPIYAPQKNVAVTGVMYHFSEPQAGQALDAVAILKRLNS